MGSELLLVSALTFAVVIVAPLLAHFVGSGIARSLGVRDGDIREWMPGIPDHIETDGRAEARWERRRKAIESKLLRRFAGGVQSAEAHALAAELGEHPEVVAGALDHMRDELPCRLRVTRSGKLLYDFAASDIASLRRKRRIGWPVRVGIFGLGVLANIGAIWPVLLCMLVAIAGLGMIATVGSAAQIGFTALGVVVALFIGNLGAGWLTHLLLTPGFRGPRLGATKQAETSFAHLQAEQAAGWSLFGKKNSKSGTSSFDAGGCGGGDFDAGCLGAIAVLLLLAVVAACTFALFVFARGIWRAATGAGMPPLDVSPAHWVRSSQPNDRLERFIPTNDLVLRVMRVLRRMVSHTHPRDSTMVGRIMARAREQDGRIAAIELAMMEGLDLDQATAIGARLSGRAGGELDVTPEGEIDFWFPASALTDAPAEWDDDLNAEYVSYHPVRGEVTRRGAQRADQLPVNLPGIAWGHVKSSDRLAAGTVLMMLCGVAVVNIVPGLPRSLVLTIDFVLPLLTLGTFALAGALRYSVSALAKLGVRRDIRRIAFLEIRRALDRGEDSVGFNTVVGELLDTFRPAWKGLQRQTVVRELEAVCIDLDLDVDVDMIASANGKMWFSLRELSHRLRRLQEYRTVDSPDAEVIFDRKVGDEPSTAPGGEDEVVFDSHVEHDRVRALG